MIIFQVVHVYEVPTNGFGGTAKREHLLYQFARKEDADAFVRMYSNPTRRGYDELLRGLLEVKEAELIMPEDVDFNIQKFQA